MISNSIEYRRIAPTCVLLFVAIFLISSCTHTPDSLQVENDARETPSFINVSEAKKAQVDAIQNEEASVEGRVLYEQKGSGDFIDAGVPLIPPIASKDLVNVKFDGAPLADVLAAILGDLLKVSYTIDVGVEGQITLVSTDPIPQESLLDMLELALSVQGIALVKDSTGAYRVGKADVLKGNVPVSSAGSSSARGYDVRIIPLKYLPVSEVIKVFEPLGMSANILRADPVRNILMLGAPAPQMSNMLRTISMLDVDVLKGMSFGIYEVVNLEPELLVERFEKLLANPELESMATTARVIALDELNSVMVVAPSAAQLSSVSQWLRRFDNLAQGDEQSGTQLYVYNVENGEAANLAALLGELFGGDSTTSSAAATSGVVAPGLEKTNLSSSSGSSGGADFASAKIKSTGVSSATFDDGARIVANEANNSLLVMASSKVWRNINSALKRMDKAPSQVLIEISIWEVTLKDELNYGVEWFFNSEKAADGSLVKGGLLSFNETGSVAPSVPGFSYLFSGSDWRAVINMLAQKSDVKSLSSPSILVLDNKEAAIQVGNQQPVQTSQTVNTSNTGVITQNVEFKDTGVQLKVRPRVNSGGLVIMDVLQEVTDVGELDQATGQRSFLKRSIESSVAIQGGDTIILGGLIQNRKENTKAGIPFLKDLPYVGSLFGTTGNVDNRTELLVTITPTAINQYRDFEKVGEEFRKKMPGVAEAFRDEFSSH